MDSDQSPERGLVAADCVTGAPDSRMVQAFLTYREKDINIRNDPTRKRGQINERQGCGTFRLQPASLHDIDMEYAVLAGRKPLERTHGVGKTPKRCCRVYPRELSTGLKKGCRHVVQPLRKSAHGGRPVFSAVMSLE